MNKKKFKSVLVVLGGTSGERAVSLDSGRSCIRALKKKGYNVFKHDPKLKNLNLINKKKIDVIFNALHGKDGEDGIAQTYFEYLRIPYTHSGVISSHNAMNKNISKNIFIKKKIITPKYFELTKNIFNGKILTKLIKKKRIKFPIVIKPNSEGSSLGVMISYNMNNLIKFSKILFRRYTHLIYEQYVGGQEIQVAVLKNKSIGAIELVPKRSFYDYKAKYTKSAKTKHLMPARLSKKNYAKVLQLSKQAHQALGCQGVTRTDFKFFKNKFYILEINTQPGMTSLSLVPEIASHRGISFSNLVEKILLDASINK